MGKTEKPATDIDRVAQLIKGIRIAMITSVAKDGSLHSRPMSTQQAEFDGTLWFFTHHDSDLVKELAARPQVNVAYADTSDNKYVSISGHGRIVENRAKVRELWHEAAKAWFPEGPDDPSLALLEIDADLAHYWEGPSNVAALAFKIGKAIMKGERTSDSMGKEGTVRL